MASEDLYNKIILLNSKVNKLVFEYKKKERQVRKLEEENSNLRKEIEQKSVLYKNSKVSLTKEEVEHYLKTIDLCIEILEDMDHER